MKLRSSSVILQVQLLAWCGTYASDAFSSSTCEHDAQAEGVCLKAGGNIVERTIEIAGDDMALLQRAGMHRELMLEASSKEENPPQWPSSVHVFDDNPDTIQQVNATIMDTFAVLGPLETGKFSSERVAFLFKPGRYELDVPVGYYTQVIGLGARPKDVSFTGTRGLYGPSEDDNNNFNTFWKAAENFANKPSSGSTSWSVSQAAPLRRAYVKGDLLFGTYNGSTPSEGSGGFVANVKVDGRLDLVRQQQWMIRNCKVDSTFYFNDPSRAANFVFMGTSGWTPTPTTTCTNTSVNPTSPSPQELGRSHAPVIVDKPYITIDANGRYSLRIPQLQRSARGVTWNAEEAIVDFEEVFVATNATDLAMINAKLALGRHVILAPGIYHLPAPIRVGFNSSARQQVLLGLGMATLVPTNGNSVVEIGAATGVRVAGLLLQAGPIHSKRLLWWKPSSGNPNNPGLIADVFARVGGPDTELVSAKTMFEVSGNHVILDNVWAWRADCCQDGCGACAIRYCDHGVVVNGDDVVSYGLFSEHCEKDLVVWNGERGATFFYQSEMDSFARQDWDKTPNYGANGVSGYRVNALNHTGIGIGVYAYFVEEGNIVKAGIALKHAATVKGFVCPFYWNLNSAWYDNFESGIKAAVRVVGTNSSTYNRHHSEGDVQSYTF
ncbi:unnamed protein product [Durusdinium trenchii]|uniref:Uncharacterized protein n=2 Tax=Durusdinium trenchii TaxID=1381693 RepID=A0ABP0IL99_9DINO